MAHDWKSVGREGYDEEQNDEQLLRTGYTCIYTLAEVWTRGAL
jgi:hypothetical protein